MAYIYKITNLINGKIYIGQTVRPINIRWNQHKSESFNDHGHGYNYHLHAAIRKYGSDNFTIETLIQCADEDRFDEESYYIKKYNSTDKSKGYNYVIEGSGSTPYATEDIMILWKQGFLINEIAEKMGCHKSVISQRLKANGITHEENMQRFAQYVRERDSKIVEQYTLDGMYVGQWPSTKACEKSGFLQSAISNVCNQKQKSAYNFLWKYKDDPRSIEEWVKNKKDNKYFKRPVAQCSIENNEIIQTFSSALEAASTLNLPHGSVCRAARERKNYKGFKWKYLDEGV